MILKISDILIVVMITRTTLYCSSCKSIDNGKKPILETSGDIIGFGPHWDHNCYIEYITSKFDTRKRVGPVHLSLYLFVCVIFYF